MPIATDGIPTEEDLKKVMPSQQRLAKGPVVIVECFQSIPCDPCAASCPFGAIKPFEDINHLPTVDHHLCTGCGSCITSCPGLAIFVVELSYSDREALIRIPYELLPLPQKGQRVSGLDRKGEKVADVKVAQIVKSKNKTNIISVIVPKDLAMVIRNIKVEDAVHG